MYSKPRTAGSRAYRAPRAVGLLLLALVALLVPQIAPAWAASLAATYSFTVHQTLDIGSSGVSPKPSAPFSYELVASTPNAPLPTPSLAGEALSADGKSFAFTMSADSEKRFSIDFPAKGEYVYTLRADDPADPARYRIDTTVYELTVSVFDDIPGTNRLKALTKIVTKENADVKVDEGAIVFAHSFHLSASDAVDPDFKDIDLVFEADRCHIAVSNIADLDAQLPESVRGKTVFALRALDATTRVGRSRARAALAHAPEWVSLTSQGIVGVDALAAQVANGDYFVLLGLTYSDGTSDSALLKIVVSGGDACRPGASSARGLALTGAAIGGVALLAVGAAVSGFLLIGARRKREDEARSDGSQEE